MLRAGARTVRCTVYSSFWMTLRGTVLALSGLVGRFLVMVGLILWVCLSRTVVSSDRRGANRGKHTTMLGGMTLWRTLYLVTAIVAKQVGL